MRTAAIQELKTELKELPQKELIELCLRLARFKQENKELLTFLLFEAQDIDGYISSVKADMDEEFAAITTTSQYILKKNLRKIVRGAGKHMRYAGSKQVEAELGLYFCSKMKEARILSKANTVIRNMYLQQFAKAEKAISGMHEDLQYDYQQQLQQLRIAP